MNYMLLVYTPAEGGPSLEEREALRPQWFAYIAELEQAGVHLAGAALQGRETATTVRVNDGETLIADGPFAETKELLAGYFLVDVPDVDTALHWAAKMPHIEFGSVEVRPVMEIPAEVTTS
jgi:hypothetical protein